MFFTFQEIFDVAVMVIAIGYIFSDMFGRQPVIKSYEEDPVSYYTSKFKRKVSGLSWDSIWQACLVAGPAVLFHELGHKVVAMYYGFHATFHAAYFWLGFGVLMKVLNTGFIFFVPAYVQYTGSPLPIENAAIAFAGPFVNLVLWFVCWFILKFKPFEVSLRTAQILAGSRYINGFLFIFNMIPLGFFDGAKVLDGILKTFF